MFQVGAAIRHLHLNGITHRDLKRQNILLSSSDEEEKCIKVVRSFNSKFRVEFSQ